jgi:GDPmannose 4,6-dehydratase
LEFVTRKISHGVARIKLGKEKKLKLGNLEAKRDWGWAPDYVEAMWLMLQQEKPQDFVVGTGKTWSVKDCAKIAFESVGLKWEDHVEVDKQYLRPAEVDLLVADPRRAHEILGWRPKTSFEEMMRLMVEADLEQEKRQA